jgi:hypothetical protein
MLRLALAFTAIRFLPPGWAAAVVGLLVLSLKLRRIVIDFTKED